jgi:hypothetical protein
MDRVPVYTQQYGVAGTDGRTTTARFLCGAEERIQSVVEKPTHHYSFVVEIPHVCGVGATAAALLQPLGLGRRARSPAVRVSVEVSEPLSGAAAGGNASNASNASEGASISDAAAGGDVDHAASPSGDGGLPLGPTECLRRVERWWTYELCRGKYLRQYHPEEGVAASHDASAVAEAAVQPQPPAAEARRTARDEETRRKHRRQRRRREGDVGAGSGSARGDGGRARGDSANTYEASHTADHYLGFFDVEANEALAEEQERYLGALAREGGVAEVNAARASAGSSVDPHGIAGEGGRPTFSEIYSSGSVCDITGAPRTAEVRYQCASGSMDTKIVSVEEVASCEYVVTVSTPLLCDHPAFTAWQRAAQEEVLTIHCVPRVALAA